MVLNLKIKGKAKRLRQAEDEALKEIEMYKTEREAPYKALEQNVCSKKIFSNK